MEGTDLGIHLPARSFLASERHAVVAQIIPLISGTSGTLAQTGESAEALRSDGPQRFKL